jgi:protein Tex
VRNFCVLGARSSAQPWHTLALASFDNEVRVMMQTIENQIALEIKVRVEQVKAAVALLDGGATVPFVARYRKEATGGLDDIQLRELEYRLGYLREMAERREAIIKSIESQGKLTPELQAAIQAAPTKQELEDLYLPYKPKRRTKGMIAREAGLEPLADKLFADPRLVPLDEAQAFVQPAGTPEGADFSTPQAVLDGVRDLLSERWAEDAALVQSLREWLWSSAEFSSKLMDGKNENDPEIAKFRDYFDYSEPIYKVPSHRALAVFRGRTAEFLEAKLALPGYEPARDAIDSVASVKQDTALAEGRIALHLNWSHAGRACDDLIRKCVSWTWKVKLSLSLERDLFARLREEAEKVAIKVFAQNIRDLLLAAPAGPKAVMGLDPGIRTGVKVAVVDATGKLLETSTVYPHEPRKDWDGALHTLRLLADKHSVELIAIGNGTASRETDKLAGELIKMLQKDEHSAQEIRRVDAKNASKSIQKVVVSESGASIYSASEYASQEMPDVDVSLRGAASIARRLQDPLAELVKIDPKSIGVGQYQHDVNQSELVKSLDAVVEDCVNGVGVDLNTASVPLLSRVAGLSGSVAKALVRHREANGAFKNRSDLLAVSGLGAKTFEQCAGFLRIRGGSNPLDATGVHPESYEVVEKLLSLVKKPIAEVMGRSDVLKSVKPEQIVTSSAGTLTVQDILAELEKPGRDPRGSFVVARFNDGIEDIKDLHPGMVLEGTVSNVAAFGAFVDLGVHQDGLIHVSQLSHKFITDAREVVRAGQVVKVKVMEVDVARKRIGLTMKLDAAPPRASGERNERGARDNRGAVNAYRPKQEEVRNSSMADKLAALRKL